MQIPSAMPTCLSSPTTLRTKDCQSISSYTPPLHKTHSLLPSTAADTPYACHRGSSFLATLCRSARCGLETGSMVASRRRTGSVSHMSCSNSNTICGRTAWALRTNVLYDGTLKSLAWYNRRVSWQSFQVFCFTVQVHQSRMVIISASLITSGLPTVSVCGRWLSTQTYRSTICCGDKKSIVRCVKLVLIHRTCSFCDYVGLINGGRVLRFRDVKVLTKSTTVLVYCT